MKFSGTQVFGLENAIVGMRLPMSKDYDDACKKVKSKYNSEVIWSNEGAEFADNAENEEFSISKDDLRVMKSLVDGDAQAGHGQPNSKLLRMVHVQVAIEAPLAWWKEFDTYKVGTTANSTSTMHRIQTYEITEDCFEKNPLTGKISSLIDIEKLENLRKEYNTVLEELKHTVEIDDRNKLSLKLRTIWYDLIYGLGDSWLQTRMCDFDYATLVNMIYWRKNHKQNCWSGRDNPDMENFIKWAKKLPYINEFVKF